MRKLNGFLVSSGKSPWQCRSVSDHYQQQRAPLCLSPLLTLSRGDVDMSVESIWPGFVSINPTCAVFKAFSQRFTSVVALLSAMLNNSNVSIRENGEHHHKSRYISLIMVIKWQSQLQQRGTRPIIQVCTSDGSVYADQIKDEYKAVGCDRHCITR